jgi:hypothetical protein
MSVRIPPTPDFLQSPSALKQLWVWNAYHLTGDINEETTPEWAHGIPCSHDVDQLISDPLQTLSLLSQIHLLWYYANAVVCSTFHPTVNSVAYFIDLYR